MISAMTGSEDPKEVSQMAKQATEVKALKYKSWFYYFAMYSIRQKKDFPKSVKREPGCKARMRKKALRAQLVKVRIGNQWTPRHSGQTDILTDIYLKNKKRRT